MLALCALAAPGQAVSAASTAPQAEAPGAPDNPLLAQYRDVSRQTAALTIYNRHLQDLLASQAQEKTSLEQQLKDIEVTKQEIVPLILHMLDSLEQFV
ncbi:MAG: DUF3450 domain-containing protein, partial [Methylobacter sp.]|uniref:DUF3450 family protein n=1 Tax=Methylobacter sp. TaxID=2051955 RepID=UPI00258A6E08